VARKIRLGVDQWGSTGRECPEITQPIQELVARDAPGFDPYPWGRFDWVWTLVLKITLVQEYAEPCGGRDDDELGAFADSFALAECGLRETLRDELVRS
jgi:endoglucanase